MIKARTQWDAEALAEKAEEAIEYYDMVLDSLQEEAKDLIDNYWQWMLKKTKEMPKKERDAPGVRAVRTKTGLSITWFYQKWYRSKKGDWRPLSQYIKKGQGMRYTDSKLLRHTPDWAAEAVLETEEKMAEIRSIAKLMSEMRAKHVWLLKSLRKIEAEHGEGED